MRDARRCFTLALLAACWTCAVAAKSSISPGRENPYNDPWTCEPKDGHWQCHETPANRPNLYDPDIPAETRQQALMYALGWINDNSGTRTQSFACGGHYVEPSFLLNESPMPLGKSPSTVNYKRAFYQLEGNLKFEGNVEIHQPGRLLNADQTTIYLNKKTGKLETIEAEGHVRLRQADQLLLGKSGYANLIQHQAHIDQATYLMRIRPGWIKYNQAFGGDTNFTGYAYGQALQIAQENRQIFKLTDATYTTCPPTSDTWQLKAKEIVLNKKTGRGNAVHTALYVHHVPIFYFPYFSFPLNRERQSGFLYGKTGLDGDSGFNLSLPYYFNIAPNYDYTFTPTIFAKRGILFGNEFRYLFPEAAGDLTFNIMPHDRVDDAHRAKLAFNNTSSISRHLSFSTQYNYVSDATYLQDLNEQSDAYQINQVILNRQFNALYSSAYWRSNILFQGYQIVNSTLSLENRPYKRLPELNIHGRFPAFDFANTTFGVDMQLVNFQKGVLGSDIPVTGTRLHVVPHVSFPFHRAYAYVDPELRFLMTHYEIKNASTNAINRAVPMFSTEAGLIFDRGFRIGKSHFTQSLSPKLFYLYTPYRWQDNIPVFDTSLVNFDYDTLFNHNRFNGIDRIGDANHLSASLETQIHDEYGNPKVQAMLGQIFYFRNRDVHLCTTPNCLIEENPNHTQSSSDIVARTKFWLSPTWQFSGRFSYDQHQSRMSLQNYHLQYRRDNTHILNLGYQQNLNDTSLLSNAQMQNGQQAPKLTQFTSSFIWQLNSRWNVLGKWNYSINASRTIDMFGGVQYSGCCWAIQFVWHRYLINNDPNDPAALGGKMTSAPLIQFELKGLGSTDSSEIQNLKANIPGLTKQR